MRWEPLLIILLMTCLSGLLIVTTTHKHRWFALLTLADFSLLNRLSSNPIYPDFFLWHWRLHYARWLWPRELNEPRRL